MPDRLKYLLQSFEWALIGSLLLKFFYWLLIFLHPILETMGALTFLIIMDLVTGLIAVKKQKVAFDMNKLFWAASKLFLYNLMVISGLVIEILIGGIPFAALMGGFIGMWEFKSIGRNFNLIYGMDIMKALKVWIANRNREWTDVVDEFRSKEESGKKEK